MSDKPVAPGPTSTEAERSAHAQAMADWVRDNPGGEAAPTPAKSKKEPKSDDAGGQ